MSKFIIASLIFQVPVNISMVIQIDTKQSCTALFFLHTVPEPDKVSDIS